ncbi:aldo/keto reductase [Trypanosoma cruzi]|nr:aldo/keto reductase [Trypanosoma cruzi]
MFGVRQLGLVFSSLHLHARHASNFGNGGNEMNLPTGGIGKKNANGENIVARTSETAGINGIYGNRAQNAIRGMLGPQGQADARESKAVPILGRATVGGTKYTCDRSTAFENWRHICPAPVGFHLSKLGSATCKMPNDINEAVESLQLQIIKGCNVFELDGSMSDVHQSVARAFYEALQAFELERDGFVIVFRCGIIKQQPFQEELTQVETSNTAVVRNRIVPIFERYKAASLPSMQLKSGFRISDLTEDQLARLNLRRVSKTAAAGLSPEWLEAFFTNVAYNTKLECIDVLLLDGFHTLFDERPNAHIDDDILQIFAYLENQVRLGVLQYYGISSPYLAPHIQRDYPPLPPDAMVPDHIRNRRPLPPVINLYRIMELARRAGGDNHHLRFVQYPFNLTFSQALNKPLPYDGNHTLYSLTRALGLTALGYSPLEATDLMELPQRYHNFPMEADLKSLRMNFFTVCERCVLKEMEVKDSIEKGPSTLPPLEHLFVASVYLAAQRQFNNLFFLPVGRLIT